MNILNGGDARLEQMALCAIIIIIIYGVILCIPPNIPLNFVFQLLKDITASVSLQPERSYPFTESK